MPSPEIYEAGVWRRALRLNDGKLVPLKVRPVGTVERPRLEVSILAGVNEKQKREVREKLRWIFNTGLDLAPQYALMDRDSILAGVKNELYGLKVFHYSTVFESVMKSIIQQQVSLVASWRMVANLIKRFGEKIETRGKVFYEFPTSAELANATLR